MRRGTFSDCGMTNVGVIDRVCVCARLSVFSHACLRACSKSPWLMALFLEKKKKKQQPSPQPVWRTHTYAHTNTAETIGKCQHIFPQVNNVLLAMANLFFFRTRLCRTAILSGTAFDLLREKAATLCPGGGKPFSDIVDWKMHKEATTTLALLDKGDKPLIYTFWMAFFVEILHSIKEGVC